MALGDTITGQSGTYVLAASNTFKVSGIVSPQCLARAPKIPSGFMPVCWILKIHNLLGGVCLVVLSRSELLVCLSVLQSSRFSIAIPKVFKMAA